MSDLTVRQLRKGFAGSPVVDNVSFEVPSGRFLTLLGPSGSGKTSTLMMIAGFLSPDAGSIEVDGRDIVNVAPNKRGLGVVFQSYALFPHKTVYENVAFPLRIRKVAVAEIETRVRRMLGLVHLDGLGERSVTDLSGGQRQRVALARALVFEPSILLMDEPLGALDRNLRERMQSEIKNVQSSLNVTTIYVTHDQDEALAMSDEIAIMDRGKIAQIGTPADLYERPVSRFVAEFLGGINLFPIASVASHGGEARATSASGVSFPCRPASSGIGAPQFLGIRPERLRVGPPGAGFLDVTLVKATYLGGNIQVEFELGGVRATARIPTEGQPPLGSSGSTISLSWSPESARLFS